MSHMIVGKESSMKGVVMRFRPSIILTITLLVLSMGLFYEAEAKTIEAGHATVSWKGKGVIDDLGDGDKVFSGTLTGTILVKHLPEGSEPAQIHKTEMDCQTILYISKNVEGTEDDPLHLEGPSRQGPRVRRNTMCWKDRRMQRRDDVGLGKGRIQGHYRDDAVRRRYLY